ncbi:hypothetical protein TNCV_2370191 [Trichonephila clavipes]|nr:hypothetical protein TNCV_2370191 [Trichonephila clavipes]
MGNRDLSEMCKRGRGCLKEGWEVELDFSQTHFCIRLFLRQMPLSLRTCKTSASLHVCAVGESVRFGEDGRGIVGNYDGIK